MTFRIVERDERSFAVVWVARWSSLVAASSSAVVGEASSGSCSASASLMCLVGMSSSVLMMTTVQRWVLN